MHQVDSPAAGLRYKVLSLPAHPHGNKNGLVIKPDILTVIQVHEHDILPSSAAPQFEEAPLFTPSNALLSLSQGNGMRMGMFPLRDPDSPRTANIILKPDHPFWNVTTVEQLYGG